MICATLLSVTNQITVTKDDTIILHGGGQSADIADRCEQIRQAMSTTTSDYDRWRVIA
jgi:chaperonin GroEL